jgi:tetratricopeptide (TPR) repeat protein
VILLPLLLAFAQAVSPELRQHVDAGLKARAAGDLDAAIREFRRVAELAPDLAAAHVNLGSVYVQKKDYPNAVGPLRRALALNSELPGAQQMLGTALLATGAAAEAIPYLEKSQTLDLLGIALLESGKPRDAVDRLEAALLQRPEDPDLLYYLSMAHSQLARGLVDRLRSQPAGATRTQQILGDAAAAAGQREEAEKLFRTVLAARPDLRGVHLALGELYLASADYAKAETEFRAEARLASASAMAAYKLGFVLTNLGKAAEALIELERADRLQPDMPETLLALGKALATTGNPAGAEKPLQRVVQLEPTSTLAEAAHLQLAQLYRRMGRPTEADRENQALQRLRQQRKK